MLKHRRDKFSLEVTEARTRILSIGQFKGTKEDFVFLGFGVYLLQHKDQRRQLSAWNPNQQEEAKSEATCGKGVAAHEVDKAGVPDDGATGCNHPRTLQLLWSKREFPCIT